MPDVKLGSLLQLNEASTNNFIGDSWDLGFRAIFGGQVLGQALSAAYQSVAADMVAHSFHTYFLLPGDAALPVSYNVEIVRDGRSFCTRRVKAYQNNINIFYMTASFQLPENGLSHQHADMPVVPQPENVESDIVMYERQLQHLPESFKESLSYHRPIDIRTIDAAASFGSSKKTPQRNIWMRAREELNTLPWLHQCSLAYASDYHFITTALQPHGVALTDKNLVVATIDHAMWFHKPINFNDWLLYSTESPFSGNGRGLVRGQYFNQNGELVASTMQEGVMRMRNADFS